MNNFEKELEVTREQLARAERALEAIRRDILPLSQPRYQLMADGYIEQIQVLRAQIDTYLGIDAIEVSGVIREVDLDKRTFSLRERPQELPDLDCEYDEANEGAVKTYLGEAVIITGILRTSRKTKNQTMEVASIESAPKSETAALAKP
jgi:hypothetical protein